MNGLIDDKGAYVFCPEDKDDWMENADISTCMQLVKEIQEFNGLTDKGEDPIVGKSHPLNG